jgi:hypothetical protein
MKINFRKIASVLATTVMLGSTVAFAAAAWPAPFVNSGASDAAVVYGSTAAATDMAAATQIADALGASVTVSSGASVTGTGDKVKIEKSSTKININNGIADVWGTSITSSNLPTLLADGKFYNKQNSEYSYEQKFDLGNLSFALFSDSDYQNKLPTLGYQLASNTYVANYTLDFVTDPESTSTAGELTDFENKNIKVLGKEYYILDFKNGSTGKITLLDSASTASLAEGETKTVTVGDKSYEVSIAFITDGQVILNVNGVNTEKMSDTGTTYGNTFKMADGAYIGIKDLNVQNYAGGTKSVSFSIGKGKLEVTDGSNVKLNDKSITDLYGYLSFGTSGSKATWQKLVMKWQLSEENFLTPGKELVMPGFEAIKFVMEDTTMPKQAVTKVVASSDYLQLETQIKGGNVKIPILWVDPAKGNISLIGQSPTARLVTSPTNTLSYNATSISGYENDGFVVSWASTREGESYYMDIISVRQDLDQGRNLTTLRDKVTGTEWADRKSGDTITMGNVVLTIGNINYSASGEKNVVFTVNSGGNFSTLYTKDGLKIWLPWSNLANSTEKGAINLGINQGNTSTGSGSGVWTLWMSESDKFGTLDQKTFNFSITNASSGTNYYTTVNDAQGDGTAYETPTSGSKVWVSYVGSALATKISLDKTASSPAQYSADVEYHGGEVYANVYVAAPSVTSTGITKVVSVKDTEVDSVKDKNLVVLGGSCINTVAAKLLGSNAALCGSAFSDATTVGAGQYLIQVVASPYNAQKVAMLVAGFEAAETTAAAAKVKEGKTSTDVGTKVVGPTAA